jgi:hypothetical protein
MQSSDRGMANIVAYRTLTEQRLSALLIRAGRPATLDGIKAIIFDEGHSKLSAYITKMLELLKSRDNDIDMILPVLQDAWNYFPHRSLDGHSPAERLLEAAD